MEYSSVWLEPSKLIISAMLNEDMKKTCTEMESSVGYRQTKYKTEQALTDGKISTAKTFGL